MMEWLPLIFMGSLASLFLIIFSACWFALKKREGKGDDERKISDLVILRRLFVYAKPHLGSFGLILLVMLLSISYEIASPLIVGHIEELLYAGEPLRKLFTWIGIFGSFLLVSLFCTYLQHVWLQKIGQKILSAMRSDLFEHIESLSHEQLNHIPVGKLVTRVSNDTDAISKMFTDIAVNLITNSFVIVGVLIAMLCLNYMLTLMILCFVPFIVLFTLIFRQFSRRAHRKVKDATTDINTYLSENLSGMGLIQKFNREKQKQEEFEERNRALGRYKNQEIFVFGVFRPIVFMLYTGSILCLFFLAGKGYIDRVSFFGQTITGGTLVSFYMFIKKFFDPVQSLADQFNALQSAFASAEKIFTVMDMVPTVQDAADAVELTDVKGEITFDHVWFAYEEEEWVLRDVSFHIEAGQTVAFVGSTGSGKSTILSLICRNYDIQKGRILLDGRDIRTIRIASLRRQFGQMLQDVFLFSGTVRSNIVLNDENISEEEIASACRYVNADRVIAQLPDGLDEEIRERGNNLSVGQRQLISFARTVVHQPKILILDEATANIDTETEVIIQDSLEKLMNIGTLLMVAHRLSTVRNADRIIVLSHGQIVEQGSHEELLANKKKYYSLYMLQKEKERQSLKGILS